MLIALAVLPLVALRPPAYAQPPLSVVDGFNGSAIDATKWLNLEIGRRINGGAFESRLRGVGSAASNNMLFANPSTDPTTAHSIQANITVTAATITAGQVRAHVNWDIYNDGVTPGGGEAGNVQVLVALRHNGTILQVLLDVFHCTNAACSTGPDLFFNTSAFGPVSVGETHTLSIAWSGSATHLITLGFDAAPPVVVDPTAGPNGAPVGGPPGSPFKAIGTRVRDFNGSAIDASITATFDNVMVDGSLYDDFGSGGLNSAKWQNLEIGRAVSGGVFTSSVRRVGVNGGNTMNLLDTAAVSTLQADVTVTDIQNTSASPEARVAGGFYNNGDPANTSLGDQTGDILGGAGIYHDGTQLRGFFFVSRCINNSCNVPGEFELLVFDDTTFGTVDLGTTHHLSAAFDGVSRFTFSFDGVTASVDPTGSPGFENAGPPKAVFKGLNTRIGGIGGPAEGASITATFDNFVGGNFISGVVTEGDGVTPLAGATVSAHPDGPPGVLSSAVTGPDGFYTIVNVPAATYRVGASAAGFAMRFFDGKTSQATADPVVVVDGSGAVGVDLSLSPAAGGTTSSLSPDTSPAVVVVPGAGLEVSSVLISENGVGALAVGGTVTLTLPAGFTFASLPTVSTLIGNELKGSSGNILAGNQIFSFTITAGSTNNPGRLLVSGISLDAAGATAGPVSVTIGGTSGVSAAVVQIATAVVASATPAIQPGFASSLGQGAAGAPVTVTGVNFIDGATICIGTVGVGGSCTPAPGLTLGPTVFGSASQLTITVNVAADAPAGTYNVTVINGIGQVATLPNAFGVTTAPTVAGTIGKPLSLNVSAAQLVTITGTGFQSPTTTPIQVLFQDGSGLVADPSSVGLGPDPRGPAFPLPVVTVMVTVSDATALGNYSLSVVNPDGGVSPPSPSAFVAVAPPSPDDPIGLGAPRTSPSPPPPPPPSIAGLNPAAALLGSAIVISGSGFSATASADAVAFAGVNSSRVAGTVTAASSGSLTVTVPAQAVDGPVTVAVNGVLSNGVPFTVTNPKLAVVNPTSAVQGKAVNLQLMGTKFAPGATVSINPGADVSVGAAVVSPDGTSIQVPVTVGGAAATGLRAVTVTNPGGGASTVANALTIAAPVAGALTLSLVGTAIASFLPSVAAVSVTLDATGKCTAKTVTPTAVTLRAQFTSDLSPPPAPPPSITFALTSSALPGTATNEDCELTAPPVKDWSIGTADPAFQQATVSETAPGSGVYQVTLYSFDMGGTVAIAASAVANPAIKGTLTLPVDTDGDGLPDAYELQFPATLNPQNGDQNGNGVPDGQDRFTRDGLSNFEKYRGIYLTGPATGTAGLMDSFQRLDPGMRHLFVRGRGWGNDPLMPPGTCGINTVTLAPVPDGNLSVLNPCPPLEIGTAFSNRGVRVVNATTSFTASTQLPTRSFANPASPTLDLLTIFYDGTNCNGAEACDQTTKTGVRQFQFPTLGFSTFGSGNAYGSARVFKRAVDAYFRHRPYQHRTNDPTRVVIAADGRPMLAPITLVADKNDNGLVDAKEAIDASGNLLGDTYVGGSANQNLSVMDVNNDGCVELPFIPDPTTIAQACNSAGESGTASNPAQATKIQVARSVATHEIGHAAGINIHTTDPTDLMYQYSINWTRDGQFSDTAAALLQIHNKGLQ